VHRHLPAMKTRFRLVLVFAAILVPGFAADSTPLRIEQTVDPHFPAALAFSPVSNGEARVVVDIDADGKLVDWLVAGYSDKAFADEAVAALKQWRYQPPTRRGEPVGARRELRFYFNSTGRVVSLSSMELPDYFMQRVAPPQLVSLVCALPDLDRPITAVQTVNPWHPDRAKQVPLPAGTVLVDFYIDEAGQPRMPVVLDSTHEAYAQAAVEALSQWRFAPPTRHGTPVAVRVQQRFVFSAGS
jgi:TonB family protein